MANSRKNIMIVYYKYLGAYLGAVSLKLVLQSIIMIPILFSVSEFCSLRNSFFNSSFQNEQTHNRFSKQQQHFAVKQKQIHRCLFTVFCHSQNFNV